MELTVCITAVGIAWMTLHVTEIPESVTRAALLGTLEYCVTQVVKSERLVKVAANSAVDTAYIIFPAI